MVMDQLVMTGLFPAGSEERRGEERRRKDRKGMERGVACCAGLFKVHYLLSSSYTQHD